MKFKRGIIGVLVLGMLAGAARSDQKPWLAGGFPQPPAAPAWALDTSTIAAEDAKKFAERAAKLEAAGLWDALEKSGHLRRVAHPDEAVGWRAEGTGAYSLGDVDLAIASYQTALQLDANGASDDDKTRLRIAGQVRANYPDRQFKPIEWVDSDATRAVAQWENTAKTLLAAKKLRRDRGAWPPTCKNPAPRR